MWAPSSQSGFAQASSTSRDRSSPLRERGFTETHKCKSRAGWELSILTVDRHLMSGILSLVTIGQTARHERTHWLVQRRSKLGQRESGQILCARRRNPRRACCYLLFHGGADSRGSSNHSWGGVCGLGELRGVPRENQSRLPFRHPRTAKNRGAERQRSRLRVVSRTGKPAQTVGRGAPHDLESREIAGDLFPMPSRQARGI